MPPFLQRTYSRRYDGKSDPFQNTGFSQQWCSYRPCRCTCPQVSCDTYMQCAYGCYGYFFLKRILGRLTLLAFILFYRSSAKTNTDSFYIFTTRLFEKLTPIVFMYSNKNSWKTNTGSFYIFTIKLFEKLHY